ncbi:MAG TPA: EamA family transporter [Bryobacteraceae bacterium]|nr:EamA family transporter [Bryobacteraceae bacterium]
MTSDLRLKTRLFTAIVVLANVFGNLLMTVGVKRHGGALGSSVLEYLLVMFNPYVATGICLLIVWMLARMALLSWADLSYVLPVTSIGYVLTAVVGRIFLGEQVTPQRWLGTVLIMAGTALVGSTAVRTHDTAASESMAPSPVETAR